MERVDRGNKYHISLISQMKLRQRASIEGQNEEQSNASSDDEEPPKKISKSAHHTIINLYASFGGRRVEDSHHPYSSKYYESVSTGNSSDTAHARKIKIRVEKDSVEVVFDADILPKLKEALMSLSLPVQFDTEAHMLMTTAYYDDGSKTKVLDGGSKSQSYHLLTEVDPTSWSAPSSMFAQYLRPSESHTSSTTHPGQEEG